MQGDWLFSLFSAGRSSLRALRRHGFPGYRFQGQAVSLFSHPDSSSKKGVKKEMPQKYLLPMDFPKKESPSRPPPKTKGFLVFPENYPLFIPIEPLDGEFMHSHLDEEGKPVNVRHLGRVGFRLKRGSLAWLRVRCLCSYCIGFQVEGFWFDVLSSLFLPVDLSPVEDGPIEPFPLTKKTSGRYSVIASRLPKSVVSSKTLRDIPKAEEEKEEHKEVIDESTLKAILKGKRPR